MPVTPFHIGPALGIKATARRHFSLRTFVITQIVIGLESARNVILRADALHGFLHSLIGATLASLVVAVVGRPILNALNSPLRALLHRVEGMPAWFVEEVVPITWAAAIVGGVVGGISHILLHIEPALHRGQLLSRALRERASRTSRVRGVAGRREASSASDLTAATAWHGPAVRRWSLPGLSKAVPAMCS